MRECDKSKIHISDNSLLSIRLLIMLDTLFFFFFCLEPVCLRSGFKHRSLGHLITSTITTLQHFATLYYSSLHLSTLHFLSFALHYSPVWFKPSTFPIVLDKKL